MPFILVKGRFMPGVGIPDGDSVRFRADKNQLWSRLEGKPVRCGTGAATKGTVQLRFEGIDAIEKGAKKPLAYDARDNMFRLIGYKKGVRETPAGYVLARMTDDKSGRPICFVFAGKNPQKDGSDVY